MKDDNIFLWVKAVIAAACGAFTAAFGWLGWLVVAWAGPWIVDERWWDLTGRRRVARLQVVCDDGAAHLVIAEHQRWWLLAAYR